MGFGDDDHRADGFQFDDAARSDWRYRRRVAATSLVDDPVFIVGHWRSGTTYLHELLTCDDRFATPTTYQCFAANHFLLTESWLPRLVWFLVPRRRPMDNVQVGWQAPQEDEFALCSLGVPSPYLRIAFPNDADDYLRYLDLQDVDAATLAAWQAALRWFLQSMTYATGRQLVLKSPTHTGRVGLLAQMFPRAKFLHIVRNPLTLYASTMKLWHVLDYAQALQRPHFRDLETYVLEAFCHMYRAFEHDRQQLDPSRIHDLRYEDLVGDPVVELEQAYARLQLGDFTPIARAGGGVHVQQATRIKPIATNWTRTIDGRCCRSGASMPNATGTATSPSDRWAPEGCRSQAA